VRDCGQRGMPDEVMRFVFESDIGQSKLVARLRHLRTAQYLVHDRSAGGAGVWRIGSKRPFGERRKLGAASFLELSNSKPYVARTRAPNSVWALADRMQSQEGSACC
jgi:hypothetical protein